MDLLTFMAAIIGHLAWPTAAVILVLILRRPLRQLIPTLRRLRYRDLELDFGEKLEALERQADQAQLPEPEVTRLPAPSEREALPLAARLETLAIEAPRAAILEAWLSVEREARAAAGRLGYDPGGRVPITRVLRWLGEQKAVDQRLLAFAHDLRGLRNMAAHAADFSPPPDRAREYVLLAERLAGALCQVGE